MSHAQAAPECRAGNDNDNELAHMLRAVDLSICSLSYWDRGTVCRAANRASIEWLGVQHDILVGCTFRDVLLSVQLTDHMPLALAALRGERRSKVQLFRHSYGPRIGLAQYVPDMRNGVAVGFVLQITATPRELRLED